MSKGEEGHRRGKRKSELLHSSIFSSLVHNRTDPSLLTGCMFILHSLFFFFLFPQFLLVLPRTQTHTCKLWQCLLDLSCSNYPVFVSLVFTMNPV